MREKRHRLPRHAYRGPVTAMFTVCVENREPILIDAALIHRLIGILADTVTKHGCTVPVFTFMPDHLHLLVHGTADDSDAYAAMCSFRRNVGSEIPKISLQKDFYDRILKWYEGWEHEAWYIASNPVRAKLIEDPFAWPFTGSIGHDLRDVFGR